MSAEMLAEIRAAHRQLRWNAVSGERDANPGPCQCRWCVEQSAPLTSKEQVYCDCLQRIADGHYTEAGAQIAAAHAIRFADESGSETTRDAEDAARYRFLREPGNAIVYAKDRNAWGEGRSGHVAYDTAEKLDTAVDAARGAVKTSSPQEGT